MSVATFKAVSKHVEGLQVDNHVRDFTVRMDEPTSLGGTDTGLNPVEAVLTALGSCLVIVANAFAKSHGIDLQSFWVELEGDLDADGFLKGKPGIRMGFQEIRFTPHFETTSPPEKVEEFLEFMKSRCPVSDITMNETKVVQNEIVYE